MCFNYKNELIYFWDRDYNKIGAKIIYVVFYNTFLNKDEVFSQKIHDNRLEYAYD